MFGNRSNKKASRPTQRKCEKTSRDRKTKEECLKVNLPGDLYERAGQWWWRTRLPGESKAKARLVKIPGTEEGACDCDTARKIAVEMWEQAVRENETKQIVRDCSEKVERLKAQFLDKIRQLTEIVESANAQAQAETQARVEIEARLNAVMLTAAHKAAAAETKEQASTPSPEPARCIDVKPTTPEPSSAADLETAGPAQREPQERTYVAPPALIVVEESDCRPQTGVCECCGAVEVPIADLQAIDSGQLLCADCIAALHMDVSRIEGNVFSSSNA